LVITWAMLLRARTRKKTNKRLGKEKKKKGSWRGWINVLFLLLSLFLFSLCFEEVLEHFELEPQSINLGEERRIQTRHHHRTSTNKRSPSHKLEQNLHSTLPWLQRTWMCSPSFLLSTTWIASAFLIALRVGFLLLHHHQ
jgi:hypothetical protein